MHVRVYLYKNHNELQEQYIVINVIKWKTSQINLVTKIFFLPVNFFLYTQRILTIFGIIFGWRSIDLSATLCEEHKT